MDVGTSREKKHQHFEQKKKKKRRNQEKHNATWLQQFSGTVWWADSIADEKLH